MTDYAIIGIGLLDSLGNSYTRNWNRYINSDIELSPITTFDKELYPAIKSSHAYQINNSTSLISGLLPTNELKFMDRYSSFGFYTVSKAIEDASIIDFTRSGLIFSSLGGGMSSMLKSVQNFLNNKKVSPRMCLAGQRDNITSTISRKYKILGPTLNITSACSSGLVSIDYAIRLLEDDSYDQMIVGACDVMVDPMNMFMFQCIGALDSRNPPTSSPFDLSRNGLVMGEGSACVIIKKLNKAISDKNKIHAIIKSVAIATEPYHETQMHEDGMGARIVLDKVLQTSRVSKKDVTLINAHATSTMNGDIVEYRVIKDYFPDSNVMALKANIGHTMAASGLVELIYTILSLQNQKIGPIANLKDPIGFDINLPRESQNINSIYAIKNSFGFGGKSSAILLERC